MLFDACILFINKACIMSSLAEEFEIPRIYPSVIESEEVVFLYSSTFTEHVQGGLQQFQGCWRVISRTSLIELLPYLKNPSKAGLETHFVRSGKNQMPPILMASNEEQWEEETHLILGLLCIL